MIQAVIFDLDDTLVDSRESIVLYYTNLLNYLGMPVPPVQDEDAWRMILTWPERDTLRTLHQRDGAGDFDALWQRVLAFKAGQDFALSARGVSLKPHAREVLTWTSDRALLALATSRGASTGAVLEHLDIHGYFQLVYTAVNSLRLKPDPWVVQEVARQFALDPDHIALVGDSEPDIGCANAAGALSVAVGHGWRGGAQQPALAVDSLAELPAALLPLLP